MTTIILTPEHRAISQAAFADESDILRKLSDSLPRYEKLVPRVIQGAEKIVEKLRKEGAGHGVEAFLQEYGLNTKEGIAIMSLAEALLRIPDSHTADDLIRDKFDGREWDKHLGQSESILVNASSWGLLLTGKVLEFGSPEGQKSSLMLRKLVGRLGESTVRESLRQAVRFIGTQFVMGTTIKEAMARAKSAHKRGYMMSYDILGEGARTAKQAQSYYEAYTGALTAIASAKGGGAIQPSLSIKLSALHPKYYTVKYERLEAELLPKLKVLCAQAKKSGVMISLDAEEAARLDIHMKLFEALVMDEEFKGSNCIGFVLQAYQKRALMVVEWLQNLAKRSGSRIPVRLVKGAYWDTEIKLSQQGGLENYPVFTRKANTDLSYLACAEAMLNDKQAFYPQFATHNAHTLVAVREMASDAGWKTGEFEFQRLHGMGEKLYDQLIGDIPCRVYAPVGRHKDLLAYLIRRLLENGANSSFVNQLMDDTFPLEVLLGDPLEKIRNRQFGSHPDIVLPKDIYADRQNPKGYDLGNVAHLEYLKEAIQPPQPKDLGDKPATNPTTGAELAKLSYTDAKGVAKAIESANKAQVDWNKTPVNERAMVLDKAAELMLENEAELLSLCVYEAGKTQLDAISELREAVDFCRYYANQSRSQMVPQLLPGPTGESNELHFFGRGTFVCISPWNFPLAIFTGQVAAALVAGNAVVAKPAEQTPLIALRAVELMHEAGIPKDVLQLQIGKGSVIGQAMIEHPDIAGVCFTGSVPVAQGINQTLAARTGAIIPLIAETGGQNCMIVDSTALLEQAVDDIILSAFGSAGQRCSALRVLMVQDSIADELQGMLEQAMDELKIGNPLNPATDVGPVIDVRAREGLLAHCAEMEKQGRVIKKLEAPGLGGSFVPPHLIKLDSIDQLEKEHFGPILHVIRFKGKDFEKLSERINATGFGLTFGLHSRIEDHWEHVQNTIHAGNLYINRNMTGAVVGVQPFGGEGLSGTGPKAGGPHYLHRFMTERTITINTAAIGGNLDLLS
ncbi:MAG: bifunctional proline dehydrogenase/L-glutamate gamma-semialdehyde dehydrogenase PutA [Rickettsiales bacterium]|nr:bifunctional proline dehydrogenase/L-glutamate gamma-semialdehyde dehydrogenase PutA [Rickettsiales bacterium]